MTAFSVGDRVLVSGVVERVNRDNVVGVRLDASEDPDSVWIVGEHVRPDTGGRDLTAQDVREVLRNADGYGTAFAQDVADRLNRIARGDVGSAGDDTAPPELDEVVASCGRIVEAWAHLRLDTPEDQALHDRLVVTSRRTIAAYVRTRPWSSAAAGPRAGDTAPDDVDEDVHRLRVAYGTREFIPADVAAVLAELDRLRSDAAGSPTDADAPSPVAHLSRDDRTDRIATAIANTAERADITVTVREADGAEAPLRRLARCLDGAGLIDHEGI